MESESDGANGEEYVRRQKRLGQIRTDMHTMYDIHFQELASMSDEEVAEVANNRDGEYSAELSGVAKAMVKAKIKKWVDPQDRDATSVEI